MDDGRPTDATARPDRPAGKPSTPRWLTGDDPLGRPPDRQVLVVGDGPAGLALGAFLASAGLDPVVVGGDGRDRATRILWPPTLELLADIGVADEVATAAAPVRSFSVLHAAGPERPSTRSIDADARAPVVVESDRLCDRLGERLPDHAFERDRGVETVREREGTAVVEFDDGVRERFDVVVATDDRTVERPRRGGTAVPTIAACERTVQSDELPAHHLRDVWHRNALVQRFPSPQGVSARLRVTTTEPVPEAWLADSDWTGVPGVEPDTAEATAWRTVPQFLDAEAIGSGWWGSGLRPRCGPAALPAAAASGLRTALAIEDAWALASVLVDGPSSVGDAVDAYTSRRSRRLSAVVAGVDAGRNDGCPEPAALRAVERLRTAALGSAASEATDADPNTDG